MNMLVKTIKRVVGKWIRYILKRDIYIVRTNPSNSWIFISYIPFVFYVKDKTKLVSHQKNEEMLAMADVFSNLGYNVYIQYYSSNRALPEIDVSLILGLEPLFNKVCQKWPNAKKIYYATGAFYKHQNHMVQLMTDELNRTFGCSLPYRRLVPPHDSCEIADFILQIGTKFTIETYPEHLRHKIMILHQSSQVKKIAIDKIQYAKENEFVFMGSGGNALKGLGVLIAYFNKHTYNVLHIIGPIEDDFMKVINPCLTNNIILHGFMNINSEEFGEIIKRCNFLIYPSGSEGCPGAVVNLMKYGIIPIVSRWSMVEDDVRCGYMLQEISESAINNAMIWTEGLTPEIISKMKEDSKKYVDTIYSIERFREELHNCVTSINKMPT